VNQQEVETKSLAPIVIFAYNRPEHLNRCLNSLQSNLEFNKSQVYIYLDGPKSESDLAKQLLIKKNIESVKTSLRLPMKTIYRENNYGLSSSIIEGLNEVFRYHQSAIIVEDDLEVSPYFLNFLNNGLLKYQDQLKIGSIHGFSYNLQILSCHSYFLRGGDCWGWATWKNRWELFEPNGLKLLADFENNPSLKNKFNLNGAYPYFEMLDRQCKGQVDSWAIRWHASLFLANRLTLYPSSTLVKNGGFDGSGTHSSNNLSFPSEISLEPNPIEDIEIVESKEALDKLKKFLRNEYKLGIHHKILRFLRNFLDLFKNR
jgi:glycosyltransferase involved in cell wall biosynthesis